MTGTGTSRFAHKVQAIAKTFDLQCVYNAVLAFSQNRAYEEREREREMITQDINDVRP